MRIRLFTIVLMSFLLIGCSKKANQTWESYGAVISLKESTPIAKILENPQEYEGKEVKLKGTVKGVCKGSGCWVEIDDGSGKTLIAKSLEHNVTVPMDCENRTIEVQGKVVIIPAEKETEEHEMQHEEGKEHEERKEHAEGKEHEKGMEEGHECPQPAIIVTMDAVRLQNLNK